MKIDFNFYAITDRKRISNDRYFYHIEKAFACGLRAIQIREKDLPPVELFRLCEKIKMIADRYNGQTFVNDRVDIMLALDLNGVHLSEQSLPVEQVRVIIGKEKAIGVSAHSVERLETAYRTSADFAVLGPVAATLSKLRGPTIMSPNEFKFACAKAHMPVFALGGIQPDTIQFWLEQGAQGVAGISIWMETPDIAVQLKQLEMLLKHL